MCAGGAAVTRAGLPGRARHGKCFVGVPTLEVRSVRVSQPAQIIGVDDAEPIRESPWYVPGDGKIPTSHVHFDPRWVIVIRLSLPLAPCFGASQKRLDPVLPIGSSIEDENLGTLT